MSTPVQVSVRCTTRKFCQTGRGTFTLLILWKRVQTLIMVDLQYILFRINCIKLHLVELSYNKLIVNYYYLTGCVQSSCQLLNVQLKKNYDSTPSVLEEAILPCYYICFIILMTFHCPGSFWRIQNMSHVHFSSANIQGKVGKWWQPTEHC